MSTWQHGETGRLATSDDRPGEGWYRVPTFAPIGEFKNDPHREALKKPSVEQKPMAMPRSMFPLGAPPGISLRNHFAGLAMLGWLSSKKEIMSTDLLASGSFDIADAMLKEAEKCQN